MSVLKVKLATAMIGISAIHLLKTFIEAGAMGGLPLCRTWQTIIHSVLILCALGIAWTDRLMSLSPRSAAVR